MSDAIVRFVFDRIPALSELRGVARLSAEEVIQNAIADAIEEFLIGCEPGAMGVEDGAAVKGETNA